MARVIRIDDEVWLWLQSLASPLEDTPNSVLRRVAGLEASADSKPVKEAGEVELVKAETGRHLNDLHRIGAAHALFHKDGHWFEELRRFPGVLFDDRGYLLFKTEDEYDSSPYLRHGVKLNVPGGIASVPGYTRL